ncbi:hypothetical protein AB9K34_19495 [Sedimentitalea sp. XS_ASV28]|uniref:hypothetical protein n=1 Tax=Sedimentitalea sp. XS_ASV28 TaxID=3241296 RepID=UPI00351339A8
MRVVYCVYGKRKYVLQLEGSIRSLRQHHPKARIEVHTTPDCAPRLVHLGAEIHLIEGAAPRESAWHDPLMKAAAIRAACGSDFLYLDNDTHICGSLQPAWDMLTRFDYMGVHAPIHDEREFLGYPSPPDLLRLPTAFPEWNSGVLFLSGRQAASDLIANWHGLLSRGYEGNSDQWLLRVALWQGTGRAHVLPATYNCRLPLCPSVYGKIRVLHGEHPDLAGVAAALNADLGPRQLRRRKGTWSYALASRQQSRPAK